MSITTERRVSPENAWIDIVMKYNRPVLRKSIWQICNSLLPYLFLWYLMYESLAVSYWITLGLSLLAAGFLIRLFIIFHDCGHRSFFKSRKANDIVGILLGILTFTPYHGWHHHHKIHHDTSGNLDKRGIGDVWTMTVNEYIEATKVKRFVYRAFRNPFVLFTIGPLYMILIQNRIPKKYMNRLDKQNIYFTDLMILVVAVGVSLLIGLKAYLLIQVPVIFLSHSLGIGLFYVQHQFEEVSWERQETWEYKNAAIKGSSFLKLPVVLQWFTGNIGFHHVHHLSSRIPNYSLERCHKENDLFKEVNSIGIIAAIKTFKLNLWDEAARRMISFSKIAIQV